MNDKKIAIFSFFAGCGMLDLGFEKSNFSIDFVNEFSSEFLNAHKFSRERMGLNSPKYGYWNTDIEEYLFERKSELQNYIIDARKANTLVGFIGGPPCPDFSIGGKNRGKDGEKGRLSLTYVDLILEMKPDFFLFENVKGLWRTARHRSFFEELKKKLHEGGFCTTERLMNALEFGVPQDRDRILLFGIRRELLGAKKCIDHELCDFPWISHACYSLEDVKRHDWPQSDSFREGGSLINPSTEFVELTVQFWFKKNNVENHVNSNCFFKPRNGLLKMQTIQEGDVNKKSYKRLHRWRYSPTAAYGNNEVHLHPYKARRISVSEALALQSLPDAFSLPTGMSLSNMFKTIGNGVPFLLAMGVAQTIRDYIKKNIR